MTTAIVLPPLTTWVEDHLTAILTATTEAGFDAAFDAFVSEHHTHVTVNGQRVSRDDYKKKLLDESAVGPLKASASVVYGGVVSVSTDKEQPIQAGLVGVFYTSTIFLKLLFDAAPEETKVTSSLNVTVVQDTSIPEPTGPFKGGDFDRRRVQTLNQVFSEVPVPNVFPLRGLPPVATST